MKISLLFCLLLSLSLMSFKLEPLPTPYASTIASQQKKPISFFKKRTKKYQKNRKPKHTKAVNLWDLYLELVERIGLVVLVLATVFLLIYAIFSLLGPIPSLIRILFYIFTLGGIGFLLPAGIYGIIVGLKLLIKAVALMICLPCLVMKDFRDWLKNW